MRSRVLFVLALVTMVATAAWPQSQPPAVGHTTAAGFDERAPRYELVPGDTLNLHFEFTPELDQQAAPVQPDGFISLKNIGDIQIAGKTLPEARQLISQSYARILRDPQITVTLQDFSKPYFVAAGYFDKPGKYDLRGPTSLTEAVAIAGGFRDGARHSEVWVFHRLRDGTVQSKKVNVKQMLKKAELAEDVNLQPGDTIYVPQGTLSKLTQFVIPRPSVSMIPRIP
jgi:protein involved in polysaccharide export with SLBB domain